MFNQIGGLNAIGSPLPPDQIGGESFIRHIGNDKLIFDFHEGSGTTVHDKSGNGNDGTFGAGVKAPTWKRNSLYFDGGDYIDLAANFLAQADFINGGSVLVICKFSSGAIAKVIDIEGAWIFHFNTSGNICSSIDGSSGLPSSISSSDHGNNCCCCIIATWDKETSNPVAGTDIEFVDGGGGEDTITSVAAAFGDFVAGDIITVSGSASNDGDYTILSVVAATINVATGELTAEGAGQSVTIASTGLTVKNIIDGVEDGISTQSLYDIDGLNRTTCIGSMYGGAQKFYTGGMKMVRILSKCLSGIECQQEYLVNKFRGNKE